MEILTEASSTTTIYINPETNRYSNCDNGVNVEVIPIEVPFSKDELDLIMLAHQERDKLRKRAISYSGPIREIYLQSIPWGYTLKDRKEALEEMRVTREYIEAAIALSNKGPQLARNISLNLHIIPDEFLPILLNILNYLYIIAPPKLNQDEIEMLEQTVDHNRRMSE